MQAGHYVCLALCTSSSVCICAQGYTGQVCSDFNDVWVRGLDLLLLTEGVKGMELTI